MPSLGYFNFPAVNFLFNHSFFPLPTLIVLKNHRGKKVINSVQGLLLPSHSLACVHPYYFLFFKKINTITTNLQTCAFHVCLWTKSQEASMLPHLASFVGRVEEQCLLFPSPQAEPGCGVTTGARLPAHMSWVSVRAGFHKQVRARFEETLVMEGSHSASMQVTPTVGSFKMNYSSVQ